MCCTAFRSSNPTAKSHLMDTRLCAPQGSMLYDWADLYWHEYNPKKLAIPGIGTLEAATNGVSCRELVTLSPLKIEQIM